MANLVLRLKKEQRPDSGVKYALAASKTESKKPITLPTREWQENFDAQLRAEDKTRLEPAT
jgi:hypothetical protein